MLWADRGVDIRQPLFKEAIAKWIEKFPDEDIPVIRDPMLRSWQADLRSDGWYCGEDAFGEIALVFEDDDQSGMTYRSFEMYVLHGGG